MRTLKYRKEKQVTESLYAYGLFGQDIAKLPKDLELREVHDLYDLNDELVFVHDRARNEFEMWFAVEGLSRPNLRAVLLTRRGLPWFDLYPYYVDAVMISPSLDVKRIRYVLANTGIYQAREMAERVGFADIIHLTPEEIVRMNMRRTLFTDEMRAFLKTNPEYLKSFKEALALRVTEYLQQRELADKRRRIVR